MENLVGCTRRLRGPTEIIGERFERDSAALLPLPSARFEACAKMTVRVSSISLVRYKTNDYSGPLRLWLWTVMLFASPSNPRRAH